MTSVSSLPDLLARSAAEHRDRPAVVESDGRLLTYGELDRLASQARDWLLAAGVVPGDRVAVYLRKSADAVAAIAGALKAGAVYVPIDPGSPPARAAYILADCGVRAAFVERAFAPRLEPELHAIGATPECIWLDQPGGGGALQAEMDAAGLARTPDAGRTVARAPDDLAYLLYTSGSTGRPKGVMISHRAALSFIDWVSDLLRPTADDRFSSHAPFHFDLSILDLYVPLKHGARVVLIGEELGKEPVGLARLVAEQALTVWYSTPSILALLDQYGRLDTLDLSSLRAVLFAGEVFPIPPLRSLKARLPGPRYCNLYGPTETNVCTWYELPPGPVPDDRVEPYPIGWTCPHYRSRVADEQGRALPPGSEGELLMTGPGVMEGYWNLPDRNSQAFHDDPDGTRWYRTGDLVVDPGDGCLLFRGRRDRMVKRRGFRIELGEIEAGLVTHPAVDEVAVVARPDEASGVQITAFLVTRGGERPSLVELKRYCVERLPRYMAPDLFRFLDALPRTSTDKVDYQRLKALA